MNTDEIVESVFQLRNSMESINYKMDEMNKKVDKLDSKIDFFLDRYNCIDNKVIKLETKMDFMTKVLWLIGATSLGLILKEIFTRIWI